MRTGKNWNILKRGLKWTIGIMAAAVICICVNVGMKGYDMYRDAISQISLKDKVEQIRSRCGSLCGRPPLLRSYRY